MPDGNIRYSEKQRGVYTNAKNKVTADEMIAHRNVES